MATKTAAPPNAKFYTIPAGTKPVRCNGTHCGAEIYFVFNTATSRTVPVDADVDGGTRPSREKSVDPSQLGMFGGEPTRVWDGKGVSHFLTCPDAQQFTRKERS